MPGAILPHSSHAPPAVLCTSELLQLDAVLLAEQPEGIGPQFDTTALIPCDGEATPAHHSPKAE